VCPLCREEHPDWESRARATLVRVAEQHGPGSYGIA
jgi:hypothetical protein